MERLLELVEGKAFSELDTARTGAKQSGQQGK